MDLAIHYLNWTVLHKQGFLLYANPQYCMQANFYLFNTI